MTFGIGRHGHQYLANTTCSIIVNDTRPDEEHRIETNKQVSDREWQVVKEDG